METGMESLTWINDKEGHEFVCAIDTDKKRYEELNEEERRKCASVNQIIGTERW